MGRKFTFAYVIVILQTILVAFKIIPVDAYQPILISTIIGVLGSNAVQKIVQPKEFQINISPEDLESDNPEYSPDDNVGFHN